MKSRTSKTVLSNALYRLVSGFFQILARIGIVIAVGRSFGPEGLGVFSFVIVLNGFLLHLANLGISSFTVYAIAKGEYKENELIGRVFPFVLSGSILGVAFAFFILKLLTYPNEVVYAALLLNSSLFFESYTKCILGIFDGRQKMKISSLITILGDAILLICVISFLFLSLPVHLIFTAYLLTKIVTFVLARIRCAREYGPTRLTLKPDTKSMQILRKSLPFAINRFVTMGFNRADILLLSYFSGNMFVGIYNAAISLILRLNSIVKPFIFALFPVLTQKYAENRGMYLNYLRKSTRYVIALAIPVFAVFCIAPDRVISLLYGAKFNDSSGILRILSFMVLLKFLNPLIASSLTASGNQSKRTVVISVSLLLNVFLNINLIPRYKAIGAAYSSVITEVFITLCFLYIVLRYKTGTFINPIVTLKFVPAIMATLLVAFVFRGTPLPVLVSTVFIAAFICYTLLRIVHNDEIRKAIAVLRKVKYKAI